MPRLPRPRRVAHPFSLLTGLCLLAALEGHG